MDASVRWHDGDLVRVRKIGWVVALLALVLDQLAKWFINGPLELRHVEAIDLLPIFRLQWVANYGVSMGKLIASSDAQR